ncbi:uncharacterized protein LOC135497907 isoform X2 [Lineus longissimus]|uniref:uncharacterized protein LOC135497907 isoform X2 n=1 Tax=Lineus longissimus TaxID=88925 RepID=UPI00315C9D8C
MSLNMLNTGSTRVFIGLLVFLKISVHDTGAEVPAEVPLPNGCWAMDDHHLECEQPAFQKTISLMCDERHDKGHCQSVSSPYRYRLIINGTKYLSELEFIDGYCFGVCGRGASCCEPFQPTLHRRFAYLAITKCKCNH